MKSNDEYDVVIIGAGWYGLIAATTYLRLAPETKLLIIDKGHSIGGVWSSERIYPNLFAQVGHGLFEYSFYPMPAEGLSPDRYISGKTIHDYLYNFARDHDLVNRIRLDTEVSNIEKMASGSWRLDIAGDRPVWTSKLIIATGVASEPYSPKWPNEGFTQPIIHSAEIGVSLDKLHDPAVKRVTVLGAAKSSYDTVFLLLKAGKQVDWVIREKGSGPLAIMPPRLLGLNTVDVMGTRALAAFSPAIFNARGFWYNALHRTKIGNFVTMNFWRFVNGLAELHAGYSKTENASKLRPIPFGEGVFWANSGLGLASVPDFWKTFHAGNVTVHRTEIGSYSDTNKIHLKNGKTVEADYVILCTGWTDALEPFNERLRVQCGLPSQQDFNEKWKKLDSDADKTVSEVLPLLANPPDTFVEKASQRRPWRLYRRLISPKMAAAGDHSIFFPGQIHSVYTPLVAEMQALWGVAFLLGQLDLPNQEDMEKEIAVWNSWTRKRYLEQGRKHAYSIYDYLAYVDTLARDLGINNSRKCNPISEMFSTYVPSDYNGLIDEYIHNREKKAEFLNENSKGSGHNGYTNGANGKVNGHGSGYANGNGNGYVRS